MAKKLQQLIVKLVLKFFSLFITYMDFYIYANAYYLQYLEKLWLTGIIPIAIDNSCLHYFGMQSLRVF